MFKSKVRRGKIGRLPSDKNVRQLLLKYILSSLTVNTKKEKKRKKEREKKRKTKREKL